MRRQLLVAFEDLLDEHVRRVGRARKVVEIAARIEQAVGVIDPDAVDDPLAHPPHDLDVRLVEHPRQFDADGRERVHREEAAVVEFGIGPAPVDELVVLGDREAQAEVVDLVVNDRGGGVISQHRNAQLASAEVPVDVERLRVPRLAAVQQHVPPPRVVRGGRDAHVVRHDVDEHTEPGVVGRGAEPREGVRSAARGVDGGVVDDVVPVVRPRFRHEEG